MYRDLKFLKEQFEHTESRIKAQEQRLSILQTKTIVAVTNREKFVISERIREVEESIKVNLEYRVLLLDEIKSITWWQRITWFVRYVWNETFPYNDPPFMIGRVVSKTWHGPYAKTKWEYFNS